MVFPLFFEHPPLTLPRHSGSPGKRHIATTSAESCICDLSRFPVWIVARSNIAVKNIADTLFKKKKKRSTSNSFSLRNSTLSSIFHFNEDMGDKETAGFNLIFFFHHCFIDYTFAVWQRLHNRTKRGDLTLIPDYPGTILKVGQPPISLLVPTFRCLHLFTPSSIQVETTILRTTRLISTSWVSLTVSVPSIP